MCPTKSSTNFAGDPAKSPACRTAMPDVDALSHPTVMHLYS